LDGPSLIDIDKKGEVVSELAARVVRDEKGKPHLVHTDGTVSRWNAVLLRHADKGPLHLAISRVSERRSYAQNRLLWHVYGQILDQLKQKALEEGWKCPWRTKDDVHEAMKLRFIGLTVERVLGEEFEREPSTTVLTVEQFSTYLRQIVEMWALKGIYIEMPGEAA